MMKNLSHEQASKLLHNKFVVVLGDSIQRAVYKDLVLLLQTDRYLSQSQLKTKGELIFEQDCLVEGGCSSIMTNGTEYREVRQYRSDHHLVRFYFLTRIFSRYMEGVLEDFRCGLTPDVVVVNSCVWDVSRYSSTWVKDYRENLERFFEELRNVLPQESLVVWNLTMPLGKNISGGFLVPEVAHMGPTLRYDIVEANFYAGKLADAYGLDVLDLHFLFRFSLQHRMRDGVHWNALAHRRITSLLLRHAAQAWGVELPGRPPSLPELQYQGTGKQFYTDSLPSCPTSGPGYFNFKEDRPAPRPPALLPAPRPPAPRPPALLPTPRPPPPVSALHPPAPVRTPRPPPPVSAPRPSPPPRRRTHPARPGGGSRGHAPHLAYRTVHHHPMAPTQYWPGNQYVMRNCHTRHYYAPYHAPYHVPYHAPYHALYHAPYHVPYHALYAYQRQHHYPYPPY